MSLLVEFTEKVRHREGRESVRIERPVEINADKIQSVSENQGRASIRMTNRQTYSVLESKAEVHARIEQAEVQRAVAIRRAEARTPA